MKRRAAGLSLAVAIVASLTACAEPALEGRVVGVTDGDTIVVLVDQREHRIRLDGVDAPERKQAFGTRARKFTSELVFGNDVTVAVVDIDRYGREVGIVRLEDGRVLNHELVKAGMAWWYEEYAPKDDVLEALQVEAKEARRGLWSDAHPEAPWEFRKKAKTRREESKSAREADRAAGDAAVPTSAGAAEETWVYITRTGEKYHTTTCRYARHAERILLKDAIARGLQACKNCAR